jgi:predicted nucleotidyltransferase
MLPEFDKNGNLPIGVHISNIDEITERFGFNEHRQNLLKGLSKAILDLKDLGFKRIYLNGSFVTNKEYPKDYDLCWEETIEVDFELFAYKNPILAGLEGQEFQQKVYLGDIYLERDKIVN